MFFLNFVSKVKEYDTNFPQATEADRGYSEIEILSSTSSSAKLSVPWAMAPIKKTTGSLEGRVVT
jgi:hypothetical protein